MPGLCCCGHPSSHKAHLAQALLPFCCPVARCAALRACQLVAHACRKALAREQLHKHEYTLGVSPHAAFTQVPFHMCMYASI